jgi:hypothetical protein
VKISPKPKPITWWNEKLAKMRREVRKTYDLLKNGKASYEKFTGLRHPENSPPIINNTDSTK